MVALTFSLYSSLMRVQFKMEGGSSLGMVMTFVTVVLPEQESTASAFALRISRVSTLLRFTPKKLFFSYSTNLGWTERLEQLSSLTMTFMSSPVQQTAKVKFNNYTPNHYNQVNY